MKHETTTGMMHDDAVNWKCIDPAIMMTTPTKLLSLSIELSSVVVVCVRTVPPPSAAAAITVLEK